jgi:hypothetical protein
VRQEGGDFMENIAARTVPPHDLGVNVNGFSKRLVAFCVVDVETSHGDNTNTVAWNG